MMNYNYLKNFLIKFYLVTVGISIISVVLYFRLINKPNHYDILQIKNSLTMEYLLICVAFVMVHLVIISLMLFKFLSKTENKSKITAIFQKIIDVLYWKPLLYIHDVMAPDLPYSGTLIIKYQEFFENVSINKFKLFIFSLAFLPRVIISLTFFVEIIFYKKIYYFIHIVILILIPILYRIFHKLCSSFVERNSITIQEPLIIEPQGLPNEHGVYLNNLFSLTSHALAQGFTFKDLEEHVQLWKFLMYLHNRNILVDKYLKKWSPYVTLFCSLLYFIAGSYKLFLLLL